MSRRKLWNKIRYSIIEEKNKREIVLLRGRGCAWHHCRFCDYHLDSSFDKTDNFNQNKAVLLAVTGIYQKLEVINSGSFVDLDENTLDLILKIAVDTHITQIHFESHWMYREAIGPLRKRFLEKNIKLKFKVGVETFDTLFRESYLMKGIDTDSPAKIAQYFDEVCLLQGLPGQSVASMEADIQTGLNYFERVCVNIMQANSMPVKPDPNVIEAFTKIVYPHYINNERVDILMENTDFGVGGRRGNVK
ncbi:radical SAM protein [Lachnospiraceae bacterium ZAX-1]